MKSLTVNLNITINEICDILIKLINVKQTTSSLSHFDSTFRFMEISKFHHFFFHFFTNSVRVQQVHDYTSELWFCPLGQNESCSPCSNSSTITRKIFREKSNYKILQRILRRLKNPTLLEDGVSLGQVLRLKWSKSWL